MRLKAASDPYPKGFVMLEVIVAAAIASVLMAALVLSTQANFRAVRAADSGIRAEMDRRESVAELLKEQGCDRATSAAGPDVIRCKDLFVALAGR